MILKSLSSQERDLGRVLKNFSESIDFVFSMILKLTPWPPLLRREGNIGRYLPIIFPFYLDSPERDGVGKWILALAQESGS
jgi:hypothetical protein